MGKKVLTTTVVDTPGPFQQRINVVSSKKYHETAVGLNESLIYHGSKQLEHDFVEKGIRGTRVAGSQFLDLVQTGEQNGAQGNRLTFRFLNPEALGSLLEKQSNTYEQSKFNHCKVVYKPIVPATTAGAIAFWFQNEIDENQTENGLELIQQASTRQAFVDTTVWNPAAIDIDPSSLLKKYWNDASGEFGMEIQGMVVVCASGALAALSTFGHLYLEYDVTFWSPSIDQSLDEVNVMTGIQQFTAYDPNPDSIVVMACKTAASGEATFGFSVGSSIPTDAAVVLYGVVQYMTGTAPIWNTNDNPTPRAIKVGDGLFMRALDTTGGNDWTDGTILLYVFADMLSAGIADLGQGEDAANNGQIKWATTTAFTGAVKLRLADVRISTGQDT